MQAGAALPVRQVADAVGEGSKGPQPEVEIKGCSPVLVEGAQQHGHAAAEHHRGLADKAVGDKGIDSVGRRQGGVALTQASGVIKHLALAIDH